MVQTRQQIRQQKSQEMKQGGSQEIKQQKSQEMKQGGSQQKSQQKNYPSSPNGHLISATRISNSVKKDKLLDYLDLLDEKGLCVNENLIVSRKRSLSKDCSSSDEPVKKKKKTSFDYIVE